MLIGEGASNTKTVHEVGHGGEQRGRVVDVFGGSLKLDGLQVLLGASALELDEAVHETAIVAHSVGLGGGNDLELKGIAAVPFHAALQTVVEGLEVGGRLGIQDSR